MKYCVFPLLYEWAFTFVFRHIKKQTFGKCKKRTGIRRRVPVLFLYSPISGVCIPGKAHRADGRVNGGMCAVTQGCREACGAHIPQEPPACLTICLPAPPQAGDRAISRRLCPQARRGSSGHDPRAQDLLCGNRGAVPPTLQIAPHGLWPPGRTGALFPRQAGRHRGRRTAKYCRASIACVPPMHPSTRRPYRQWRRPRRPRAGSDGASSAVRRVLTVLFRQTAPRDGAADAAGAKKCSPPRGGHCPMQAAMRRR